MGNISIQLVPYYHTFVEGETRPYCLNYSSSNGELAATRFTYDKRGRSDMSFYQQIIGQRSSKNVHEFDKQNRLIRKFREYSDGERSTELFVYDSAGKLVEESFENSKGDSGTARYEYDSQGSASKMLCDGYKGWFKGEIAFDFDQDGKRLSGRIIVDGVASGTITYKYDRQGNLTDETWIIGEGWNQTLRYVYETF